MRDVSDPKDVGWVRRDPAHPPEQCGWCDRPLFTLASMRGGGTVVACHHCDQVRLWPRREIAA